MTGTDTNDVEWSKRDTRSELRTRFGSVHCRVAKSINYGFTFGQNLLHFRLWAELFIQLRLTIGFFQFRFRILALTSDITLLALNVSNK